MQVRLLGRILREEACAFMSVITKRAERPLALATGM